MLIFFELLGFLFISSTALLFHYVDYIFKPNKLTDLLSINNNSIWENLKVVILPIIFWSIIEIPALYKNDNLLIAKTLQIIVSMAVIFIIYYSTKAIFKRSDMIIKSLAIYVGTFLGALSSYVALSIKPIFTIDVLITFITLIGYFVIYILLTYIPPKLGIFKDPDSEIYGIN